MLSNLSDLDLRLIRIFHAVVDAGGLTPAQSTLNIGQSTISTQLAVLETRLGFRLCERGRAGFRLTAKGERFADLSRKLMANFDEFTAEVRNMDHQLVGTMNIGMLGQTSIFQSTLISNAIARFRQRSEAVRFAVTVRPPRELEEKLLSDELQISIGYFGHRVAQLEYTPLFVERQVAYCGRGHALFEQAASATLERLGDCEWTWRSYPLPEAQNAFKPHKITAIADNMEAVAILILSGHHLGFLPEHFAAPYVERGLMAPLGAPTLKYDVTFHMVTRNKRHHSEITRAMVEDFKASQLGTDMSPVGLAAAAGGTPGMPPTLRSPTAPAH
jgi:DNA-binding transcriptional LysR family regulator